MAKYTKKGGNGGKRPGAGRRQGTPNVLDYGEVKALKASMLRVPADAPDDVRQLAQFGLGRIIDVALGEGGLNAGNILKAATRLREEACGPLAQKLEHTGKDGSPLTVSININRGKEPEGE